MFPTLPVAHCGTSVGKGLPDKHHDDGAPRGQQDIAERVRHRVTEYRQLAPGFILNRPQRRRYRSCARAGAEQKTGLTFKT